MCSCNMSAPWFQTECVAAQSCPVQLLILRSACLADGTVLHPKDAEWRWSQDFVQSSQVFPEYQVGQAGLYGVSLVHRCTVMLEKE